MRVHCFNTDKNIGVEGNFQIGFFQRTAKIKKIGVRTIKSLKYYQIPMNTIKAEIEQSHQILLNNN